MVAPSTAHGQIRNPGFEINDAARQDQPADWEPDGDGGEMRLDASIKHDGERSLRLQKAPGATFTGVSQVIDATPFRGKIVVLRGWMRGDHGDGLAGLSVRVDSAQPDHPTYVNDFRKPTVEWTRRQVILDIDAQAQRIVFRARATSNGPIWVDSLEISELDAASAKPLQRAANDYLEEALGIIRANALYADTVDWAAAMARAKIFASGATTPAEAHEAVRQLLRALNDHHSLLSLPDDANRMRENTSTDFGIASAVVDGKGYVRVPGLLSTNNTRTAGYANDVAARVSNLRQGGACGWVIDLRDDTGGNMDPMLTGLGTLLGNGTLGYFVGKTARDPWSLQRFYDETDTVPPTEWPLTGAPVAVLTGPGTSSAGELVAISFRGRPRTRFFGSPTSGRTTANRGFKLSDGSMIGLAVSRGADRTGRIYDGAISPDELIATTAAGSLPAEDPVVQAAIRWLDTQEPCRR
jgi:carboxyl-terminal processing protease